MPTLVLAGNPNCGKTALFNALTGSHQRIGNWPGVTVEQKSGYFRHHAVEVTVVDLPGVYTLNVQSDERAIDEHIACDYLLTHQAQLVVNVIDASNLVRNLYLTLQLLEMQQPMILAVNMMDVAQQQGLDIHVQRLGELLHCPVVPLVVTKAIGIVELKEAIITALNSPQKPEWKMPWPLYIQEALTPLQHVLSDAPDSQWLSIRLLENDYVAGRHVSADVQALVRQETLAIEEEQGEEADILMAEARYGFIGEVVDQALSRVSTTRQSITQHLDKIVLNRMLGIPIFFAVMYLMFLFAINVGGAFQDLFDISSDAVFVGSVTHYLSAWHWPDWLIALMANGVGRGINTVITFVPVIGAMFLFLSFLEDSGYMARAAFVMDRFMQAMGLPGKAFVPMIVGFGCNVPAVMAARTLSNRRDRILTVMMMPFMSCGARLAIFAVFASAFFQEGGQNIIFLLYVIGILVAILTGFILRKTVLRGEPASLIMEMPSYHWPKLNSIVRHAGHRLKSFITRAGQVIIPVCMLIGILNSVNVNGDLIRQKTQQPSLLAKVGQSVTPLFEPMGVQVHNWPATVGLVTGVLAKEVVVGTLNTLYSQSAQLEPAVQAHFRLSASLKEAFSSVFINLSSLGDALMNPWVASEAPHEMNRAVYGVMYQRFGGKESAFAYLLFVLLYFPCVSTVAAMRREVGGGWAAFSMVWSTGLAYSAAVLCYQAMTLMQHVSSSLTWIAALCMVWTMIIFILRRYQSDAPSGR